MSRNPDPQGNNPPAGGRVETTSRLVNTQEVALTVLFLIVLTMILLYGISHRWPACELPEEAAAAATNNTNGSPNANGGNVNAAGAANNNAAANTNANAQANANTGGNANGNTNANGNQNTNGAAAAGAPPAAPPPQPQPAANQNQDAPFIRTVEPGSGDIRGNKMVTIRGERLGSDVVVKFDQRPARNGSSSTDSMIVWTPHHAEGAVDVSVERGSEKEGTLKKNVLPGGYVYVCPTPTGSNLFLMLIMAGALGGCVHALRSLFWYVGNRELRLSWLPMYFILPFVGAAMAMIFSLLILAGLIDDTSGRNMSLFIIAVAGLVGMFSQQAALKLTDIANATFTKPGPGKDSRQQESQSVGAGAETPGARIEPNSGPPRTPVVISGTGFTEVKSVTFGGVAADDAAFDKPSTNITATAPEHAPGPVSVVVTNAAGKTVTLNYTYTAPDGGDATGGGSAGGGSAGGAGGGSPDGGGLDAAAEINPPAGPAAGNTPVTITGTGFTDVAEVLFGDTPSATPPAANPDEDTVTATAPEHEPGVVTVTVSNAAGEVKTLEYEYE